ncbi:deoxynucleoside kinase [Laceyella tengchongensis]|uniref:deoxynucleoside kinase n=1 Tax=Laceyella tengchongensis TaxID=574699 RepID=UPI0012B75A91|nr:hypothetical protein [Laceyella tengchongensis]
MFGIGKTTYAQILGEYLGSKVIFESVNDNPILSLFYQDPYRYGFLLQIYFLAARLRNIKEAKKHPLNILDRSMKTHLFVKLFMNEVK